ncbi:MAG: type II secretion system F family protein [Planctomycetota bacterium]|nr:type II secretion system F family protein [Planctomycetota bacterium]
MSSAPRETRTAYLAARPDGGRRVGLIRARDARHLAEQLRRERLVPLRTWTLPDWAPGGSGSVRLKDQCEVHTQLAQLLNRGVPLVEALDVVRAAVAPGARPKVDRMRELVAGGSSFADACRSVGIFDIVTIAVYRASERTGDLGGAAKQLALTTRRQLAISGKAGTLLIYPAVVLSISICVAFGMITYVVPLVAKSLTDNNQEIPLITRVLVDVGLFLRGNLPLVALVVLGLVTGGVFARKRIGALVQRAARRVPLMRDVMLAQESARFFTVMAAMTRSGITLADALGVAIGVINYPVLKAQLQTLRTRLIEGGVLRQLIDAVDALPLSTRRLLIAAERAGDLESAFDTLATDTADELDRRSQRLLAALEPLLIVFLFAIIGTLLLSIMIPIIQASAGAAG